MSDRTQQRKAKLKERCDTLADVIESVGPVYRNPSTNEDQRGFIETMIGAALWYLPIVDECWTGKVSSEAVKSCHPNAGDEAPKLTSDHEYPRKIAAADLLAIDAGELKNELMSLYTSKYGRFNYITPRENRLLMRYQRKSQFVDPASAYKSAGIKLIAANRAELKNLRARDLATVEGLLNSVDQAS